MRVRTGPQRHQKHKKILERASGFQRGSNKRIRKAKQAVLRAEQQAFVGRKLKKRQYRQLWITRINIATREHGLSYSRFINGLQRLDVRLDRKQLSEMAIHQPDAFAGLVEQVKALQAG